MKKYLSLPYPFYYEIKTSLVIAILIFILSTLFSYFFEPFEVNYSELKFNFFMISMVHSILSLVVFMISVFFLNLIRNPNQEWKIKHEFIFLLNVLVLIGVFQFLIRDFIYVKNDNWSIRYLFEEVRNTVLIGALLIFIITSINIERLKNIYNKKGKQLHVDVHLNTDKVDEIEIITQVKSDDFMLNINELLYAKSDKNYVEFFLNTNEILLKRLTIKSLEDQFSNQNIMCRTHRSFIVNLLRIREIKGNTQGYKLYFKNSEESVPVSRSMISKFENQLKRLNTSVIRHK